MAFSHGKNAILWLNGFKLSAYLRSINWGGVVDLHDKSVFEMNDKEYMAGMEAATLSADGLFDGAADAIDDRLKTLLGVAGSIFTYLPQGDGFGNRMKSMEASQTAYNLNTPTTDLSQVHIEATSNVGHEGGIVLSPMDAKTADGNGTSVDNAALSSAGAAGYVQYSAVAGTGSVQVSIQDSADDTVWADLMAFAAVAHTDIPTAQRMAVTGTVRRYLRAEWDLTTITSVTLLVAVSRK